MIRRTLQHALKQREHYENTDNKRDNNNNKTRYRYRQIDICSIKILFPLSQ